MEVLSRDDGKTLISLDDDDLIIWLSAKGERGMVCPPIEEEDKEVDAPFHVALAASILIKLDDDEWIQDMVDELAGMVTEDKAKTQ